MFAVTIFALFGDDFRLWFTPKSADIYIDIALIFCLACFSLEILVNSCVVDDFKYSFFFWLDIIATISIMVDITILVHPIEMLVGLKPSVNNADAFVGEVVQSSAHVDKISKIIKSLRLIRLIRIIKLYKYVAQSKADMEEARLREQQRLS